MAFSSVTNKKRKRKEKEEVNNNNMEMKTNLINKEPMLSFM